MSFSGVLGEQEPHSDLRDHNQTHVFQSVGLRVISQVFIIDLNFVLAEIFDEKSMSSNVPSDLSMLLADCVLVGEAEIIRVVFFLSADVNLQRAVLFDVKRSTIFCDNFAICRLAIFFGVFQVHLVCLLTKISPTKHKKISKHRHPEIVIKVVLMKS